MSRYYEMDVEILGHVPEKEDQIRYLVDGIGAQHAERQLDELIESQPKEGK